MNASEIIDKEMTLEEKLEAIDLAMSKMNLKYSSNGKNEAPIDPSTLLMCEGCQ